MDRRELYGLCCDCKYATRNRGGNPMGCLIQGPRLTEETCQDFTLWWTKPPTSRELWKTVLIWVGATLVIVPVVIWGFIKVIRFVFGGIKVNKENLGLYIPGRRRRY